MRSTALHAPSVDEPAAHASRPGRHEVEIWSALLDEQPPHVMQRLESLLAPDERERSRRFRFPHDARRFVAGRGILRMLLARYLGCDAQAVNFEYGTNGKPALASPIDGAGPLHFNLAHAGGLALYAFARAGEVGVDVEEIRDVPEWKEIAAANFPATDVARVCGAEPAGRQIEFFRAWTREEARLKASGVGLGGVDTTPEHELACSAADSLGDARRQRIRWVVHPVPVPTGYVGAVAVPAEVRCLIRLEWSPGDACLPPPGRGRAPGSETISSNRTGPL